jgi:hypothetical protein
MKDIDISPCTGVWIETEQRGRCDQAMGKLEGIESDCAGPHMQSVQ